MVSPAMLVTSETTNAGDGGGKHPHNNEHQEQSQLQQLQQQQQQKQQQQEKNHYYPTAESDDTCENEEERIMQRLSTEAYQISRRLHCIQKQLITMNDKARAAEDAARSSNSEKHNHDVSVEEVEMVLEAQSIAKRLREIKKTLSHNRKHRVLRRQRQKQKLVAAQNNFSRDPMIGLGTDDNKDESSPTSMMPSSLSSTPVNANNENTMLSIKTERMGAIPVSSSSMSALQNNLHSSQPSVLPSAVSLGSTPGLSTSSSSISTTQYGFLTPINATSAAALSLSYMSLPMDESGMNSTTSRETHRAVHGRHNHILEESEQREGAPDGLTNNNLDHQNHDSANMSNNNNNIIPVPKSRLFRSVSDSASSPTVHKTHSFSSMSDIHVVTSFLGIPSHRDHDIRVKLDNGNENHHENDCPKKKQASLQFQHDFFGGSAPSSIYKLDPIASMDETFVSSCSGSSELSPILLPSNSQDEDDDEEEEEYALLSFACRELKKPWPSNLQVTFSLFDDRVDNNTSSMGCTDFGAVHDDDDDNKNTLKRVNATTLQVQSSSSSEVVLHDDTKTSASSCPQRVVKSGPCTRPSHRTALMDLFFCGYSQQGDSFCAYSDNDTEIKKNHVHPWNNNEGSCVQGCVQEMTECGPALQVEHNAATTTTTTTTTTSPLPSDTAMKELSVRDLLWPSSPSHKWI